MSGATQGRTSLHVAGGGPRRATARGASRASSTSHPSPGFAMDLSAAAGAADLLSLQRTVGNRAVDQLLQGRIPSAAEAVIRDIGRPLDPDTRSAMEARFGHDFDGVRVHDDDHAAESAKSLAARAYTVDRHIVFGRGRYAPGTREGSRLIAR